MITNFKIFENLDDSEKFWKVRVDKPYFEAGLYKLNVNTNDVNSYLRNKNIQNQKTKYVYIAPFIKISNSRCSWNADNHYGKINFEGHGLVYQGILKITKQDIKNIKIKKEAQKYNL